MQTNPSKTEQIQHYKIIVKGLRIGILWAIILSIAFAVIFKNEQNIFGLNLGLVVGFFSLTTTISMYLLFRRKLQKLEQETSPKSGGGIERL